MLGYVALTQSNSSLLNSSKTEIETELVVPKVSVDTTDAEQLLADRRALSQSYYSLEPDVPADMLEDLKNPSPELIDAIVADFVAGKLNEVDFEKEFIIIDDWPEESLNAYLETQDLFALTGVTRQPLPEPFGYRDTADSTNQVFNQSFRFELSADTIAPVSIYAVDPGGAFSGILDLNGALRLPYNEVRNVSPSSFINQGIQVDRNAAAEFTIMARGTDHGIFLMDYIYYGESETNVSSKQWLTTPDMLASATAVVADNKMELYPWRVDYDGDGKIDFMISHNGIPESQASDMYDFFVENGLLVAEWFEGEDARTTFVELLSS